MPDGGKHIEDLALEVGRHRNTVGCEQGQMKLLRQSNKGLIAGFLIADRMSLQFYKDIALPKRLYESLQAAAGLIHATPYQRSSKRTLVASSHANQAFRIRLDASKRSNAIAFRPLGELVAGNEERKVLIASLRFAQQRKTHRAAWDDVRLPGRWQRLLTEAFYGHLCADV